MRKFAGDISQNLLGNIKYRNNVVTGVIAVDNGNYTYDVYISSSADAYPGIPTTMREPDFSVGDAVEILMEYGNKEMPIIIGLAKKVVQEIKVIDINTLVTTLDAYSITGSSAYLELRIEDIDSYENCTKYGFYYGTTTAYGLETSLTGSFVAGSYSLPITGLSGETTYHYQAYVLDADGDEQVGENKTFITGTPTEPILYENQLITDDEFMNAYGSRWVAYFFQAESNHTVEKIALLLNKEDEPGIITVAIYPNGGEGSFPDNKPVIGGGALTSGNTDGDTLPAETENPEWREIEVTPYSLVAGTYYSIVLTATLGYKVNWFGTNEDVRPDQWRHFSEDNGATWYAGQFDLTYKIYGY